MPLSQHKLHLLILLGIALAYSQVWLRFVPIPYNNDLPGYVKLAQVLGRLDLGPQDLGVRTPGYPLLLRLAATLSGSFEYEKVPPPTRRKDCYVLNGAFPRTVVLLQHLRACF